MNGSNAVNASESTAQLEHSAIIYTWKQTPGHLSAAMERAFSFRYRVLKRALDIVISLFLLIALLPLGLAIALLVAITSPGPVFYCEERIGRFRVPFRIIKFRSMHTWRSMPKVVEICTGQYVDAEASRFRKKADDPRITPVGRVLRRMSIDELPQLWNVLVGDMSLVGPRPIIESERRLYGANLPYYDLFCPGITGLWQISGRSEVDYDRRVMFDRQYASQWSWRLDLVVLARTIPAVLSMRGAY